MSSIINFEDIQKGDTIRVEWQHLDSDYTVIGEAFLKRGIGQYAEWYSREDAQLTRRNRNQITYLLNRPKPPLPTEPGTIIYANMPVEGGFIPLILRDDKWWYLSGESFYRSYEVLKRDWKLAKVVTA